MSERFPGLLNRIAMAPDTAAPGNSTTGATLPLGLALGGGSARGFAHIGVLRVLDEAGIRPHVITGTSIGAVVGGCYLAGRLDQLEEWARALTRRRVLAMLDFSLGGSGLISGTRLTRALERELGPMAIEDLQSPFAAIATEISAAHEVWMTSGSLITAMRASLSLPGIFEPVRVGGHWLMDGALVNPVPVNAARALGARIVLAVSLNSDGAGRGTIMPNFRVEAQQEAPPKPMVRIPMLGAATALVKHRLGFGRQEHRRNRAPGISTVMIEAFNIAVDRISRSRLAGDPPDITVFPRLASYRPFDFHRAGEIIDLGAEATRRALDTIGDAINVRV